MTDEKNLISLKDASRISGYSSDYIGQLIRAGKIPGKQVYTNVSWMTTAQAVEDYKNNSERNKNKKEEFGFKSYFKNQKQLVLMELNIFKLFFKTFKSSLPPILIMVVTILLLAVYTFNYLFNVSVDTYNKNKTQKQNEQILF